jgi:MoaA/NifB/PqqE/SkfB family radical SAM enzyme
MTIRVGGDCAFLFLTNRCNLSCRHCYVSAGPYDQQSMSDEIIDRAIGLFNTIGIRDVRLTGGEPTVHPRFDSLIERLSEAGISVGLATNGIRLLWRSDVDKVLQRLSRCWVSIYGPTEETHAWVQAANRPIRVETIIKKVGELSERGYNLGLSVLVTPGTTRHLRALLGRCAKEGVKSVRFIAFQDDGRGRGLFALPLTSWRREFLDLWKSLATWPETNLVEQVRVSDMFDLDGTSSGVTASCLLQGRRMWSVTPDGAIYPCCFTAYEAATRVGYVSDEDISGRLLAFQHFGTRHAPCKAHDATRWAKSEDAFLRCPISIRQFLSKSNASEQDGQGNGPSAHLPGTTIDAEDRTLF